MTTPHLRVIRATVLGGAVLSLVLVTLAAGAASAHVEPDPATAQAGTTTRVEVKTPAGVTDVATVDKTGWTGAAAGGVVTYSGGRLGPDTPDTFGVKVKLPAGARKLAFPTVQTCEKGSLDWIEPTPAGGAEPQHPAPVVDVTAGAPSSFEAAGSQRPADTGHDQTASSGAVTDTGLDTIAGQGGKKNNDNKTLLIGGGVAVAVVIAGGLALTQLRKRDAQR